MVSASIGCPAGLQRSGRCRQRRRSRVASMPRDSGTRTRRRPAGIGIGLPGISMPMTLWGRSRFTRISRPAAQESIRPSRWSGSCSEPAGQNLIRIVWRVMLFVWCSTSFPHQGRRRWSFGRPDRRSRGDLTTPTGRRADTVPRLHESGCRERPRPTRRAPSPAIRSCIRRALGCAPSPPLPRRWPSRGAGRGADPFHGRRRCRLHVRATQSAGQDSRDARCSRCPT